MKNKITELKERYVIDDKWRTAWQKLANKHDRNNPRLQTTQEYIENRAFIANDRIFKLMADFDHTQKVSKILAAGI